MYPRRIVERARQEGLDIIAVTDHNAADNAGAVIRAAAGTGLTVFPGMEISSEEDVHILGIFETMEAIDPVLKVVARNLAGAGAKTDFIRDRGGLAIASHVDRESFSLISQLGFVPPDLRLDALEASVRILPAALLPTALPLVAFSDAHCAGEIGRRSTGFLLAEPQLSEIRLALAGAEGRRILDA